jgi:UPF0755 protein
VLHEINKFFQKDSRERREEMGKRRRRVSVRNKKGRYGYVVVLLLFMFLVATGFWWSGSLKPVSDYEQSQVFVLKQGMNAAQIAQELEDLKVIRSAEAFRHLCRIEKADSKLVAGMYYLSPSLSSQEILDILLKGPVPDVVRITIPEGYTVAEIAETLAKNGLGTEQEFYQAMQAFQAKDYSFLKDVPSSKNRLEGFLFPDTYFFAKNVKPQDVIDRFLQRFERELTVETQSRLKELDISIYTWVTKASIVEREAVKPEERPIIAGVFDNRLGKGMALESCATVQYVLGEVKPVLSLEDIAIDSPYNTYKNSGLPPGPIANPGHASLEAVLYSEKTDYFFFVAKNDGSHAFAVTYDEHLRNVSKYQ